MPRCAARCTPATLRTIRAPQVFLQPPLLQLTAEAMPGVSTQALQSWMLLLRFDLRFLQVWVGDHTDILCNLSQEVPNLTGVELSLPVASVSPSANATMEVHAAMGESGAGLPWQRGQQVC